MNPFEMVIGIVLIATVGSIFRMKYSARNAANAEDPVDQAEKMRLREEVKELKERLKVLERITVDKENSLARQIDDLRDR